MLITLILFMVVILLIFFYKNKRSSRFKKTANSPLEQQRQRLQSLIDSKKYWGFYIDYIDPSRCCEAVLTLDKKPFPINSVPALPLDNCTKSRCFCKHTGLPEKRRTQHHRRKVNDRRNAIRFEEISDRRSHMDRRSDNWAQRRR